MLSLQGEGRPPGQRAGRISGLVLGACAALAAAPPGIAEAAGPPSPVEIPGDGWRKSPVRATLPMPSRQLPEEFTLSILAVSRLAEDKPVFAAAAPVLAFPYRQQEAADFDVRGFSGRLMARMRREALRYRRQNLSDASAAPGRAFEDLDTAALERRSHEASRIVTRAVRRALDVEIERVARASLGLGPTIDLLGHFSSRGTRSRPPAGNGASLMDADPSATSGGAAGRWRSDIGMRLDAHPALVIRTHSPRVAGRLELPVRNEPIRLSLECPIGPRGRAVLSSGLPRDGQGWATATIRFSF
ncbi:MAG: hypothetical protein HYS34_08240 [Acidobacteria bacterium]|nr:hypothetical protein [Acidobacteriota bacterium]